MNINESTHQPQLRMARSAFCDSVEAIMARPPESGGLLLGPIHSTDITAFHFDDSGTCTGAMYTPDHATLNRLLREQWLPQGLDMKGFIHSHPFGYASLSPGDLRYIRRLLNSNADMDLFAAPIVIPGQFLFCPIVVLRDDPHRCHYAKLELF